MDLEPRLKWSDVLPAAGQWLLYMGVIVVLGAVAFALTLVLGAIGLRGELAHLAAVLIALVGFIWLGVKFLR